MHWFKVRHRFAGNDGSIIWAGQVSVPLGLEMETPWYHCPTCLDSDEFADVLAARLPLGSRFCSGCGTALDWDHTSEFERDDVIALVAEIERKTGERLDIAW